MAKMVPGTFDYREVPCPHNGCGAKAGSYCKRPSGHSGPLVAPHKARREAAQAEWAKHAAQPAPEQAERPPRRPPRWLFFPPPVLNSAFSNFCLPPV
jgi:hypothetical protein